MSNTKNEWMQSQLKHHPNARYDVINFIGNILYKNISEYSEIDLVSYSDSVVELFTNGYCYYFAVILKDAFGGSIYRRIGYSHIVWKDENDIFYDINGVVEDCTREDFILIDNMSPDLLETFRHRKLKNI